MNNAATREKIAADVAQPQPTTEVCTDKGKIFKQKGHQIQKM